VGIALAGVAKTFLDGMHAVSLLTLFIGLIFLSAGIFKDGFPRSSRSKSATFITLGFLVTFGVAAAVTVSTAVPSIYAYIGLMIVISIPATVIIVASYKQSPYIKAISVIFIGAAVVGGGTFYAFGLVSPKTPSAEEAVKGQEGGNASSAEKNQTAGETAPAAGSAAASANTTDNAQSGSIVNVTILPGASAQGNPSYDPSVLNVSKGESIEWTNGDNSPHTVTSFGDQGKTFDSSLIMKGDTFVLQTSNLSQSAYDYFCTLHPFMKAKFVIGGGANGSSNNSTSSSNSSLTSNSSSVPSELDSVRASDNYGTDLQYTIMYPYYGSYRNDLY
jgi:plastocyanin